MSKMIRPLRDLKIRAVEVLKTEDKTRNTGEAIIRTVLSNVGLETGFFARELGVFAQDPDTGEEILYGYGNAGYEADYIPACGGSDVVEYLFNLSVIIGEAERITATMAEGVVFVTQPEFDRRMISLFGEPKPVMEFWTRTEGDGKKLRPVGITDARMALMGLKDMAMPREKYLELSNASIQNALNYANGRSHTRKAIESESEAREKAIEEEAEARRKGDSTETTERQNADTELQNRIKSEAQARQNNDNAEASARTNADNAIQNRINNLTLNGLGGNLDANRVSGLVQTIQQNSNGIIEASITRDGYAKFGNGLIIQWGVSRKNAGHENFITPFPNTCLIVVGCTYTDDGCIDGRGYGDDGDNGFHINAWDRFGFGYSILVEDKGDNRCVYIAIGN